MRQKLVEWSRRQAGALSATDRAKTSRLLDELETLVPYLRPGTAPEVRQQAHERRGILEQWLSFLDGCSHEVRC